MSVEEAAVFRNVYHTAYHALLQRGRLKAGDWVLIHGAAGGIGLPAIQIAKLYGAKVIAAASTDEKRAVCLEEGADHAIDYQAGFRDRVMELTGGRGLDIVYDPVNGPTFEESLRCLAWGGRILILGFLGGAPALARTNYLLIKGIEAIGVRIGGLNEAHPEVAAANIKTLVELAGQGKLKPHIWRRFPLESAADTIQALIDRKVIGKAVLVGQPGPAAERRRYEPVRGDRVTGCAQRRLEINERSAQCGAELRRIENRRAVGFDIDQIDVAALEAGKSAARRTRGRERRR